ncbi:transcriptional regulator, XRE family with cupin sensor [Desulfacinum hydrothermale DSM 13146]|uniref:Transcriptional regulator, XRE family with cupin sensor n=1 Tax=Desulfacinum hydrothermale DSM 13146 TaxID=1121390 RepID=A0A1W1XAZ6_9BACT|nr:XRE family transcriptional regulator [Desulfacinum hydrothermale]SMC21215.1 transcriptional regulator, XRE family with cupin sensor [Desulfacinum hydrothermale DSM 13146]
MGRKAVLTTGIEDLDRALGGVRSPETVLWVDEAGDRFPIFGSAFARHQILTGKPLVFVSFDRLPHGILAGLELDVKGARVVLVDCFSHGKASAEADRLEGNEGRLPRFARLQTPSDLSRPDALVDLVLSALPKRRKTFALVFESLTGMVGVWKESGTLHFMERMQEVLQGRNTITYWVTRKKVHSRHFREEVESKASVVVELSAMRNKPHLTLRKASGREGSALLGRPLRYWQVEGRVSVETKKRSSLKKVLGRRLRKFRVRRGISQTELAQMIGVTPSSISQIESNLIYPSIPALVRMAEVLDVDVSAFFSEPLTRYRKPILEQERARKLELPEEYRSVLSIWALAPEDMGGKGEPYVIEIPPGAVVPSHFFSRKTDQMGYVLQGRLIFQTETGANLAGPGDVIYLAGATATEWRNLGEETARLFWVLFT